MITIASLYKVALDNGANQADLPQEDDFEVLEPSDDSVENMAKNTLDSPINPLQKFSLNGMSQQYRQQMNDDEFVLEGIALRGQISNIYASPGSGKTLLTMKLLMNLLEAKR
ncbi:MAG: hypothetical protein JKX87_02645 [Cycloclasticus sp.]|nr:hypothetical protein [Cycloclasticus sp.]